MKAIKHSSMLAITVVVSAAALFAAISKNLNAGQGGYPPYGYYPPYGHYGYDRDFRPPAPPGYMYQPPGRPHPMRGYGYRNSYSSGYPMQGNAPATEAPAADAKTVGINRMRFEPAIIRVKAGDTVTWANNASMPHTVTGRSDGALSSERLGRGSLFSHTFKEPGTYEYYCALHPSMTGSVIVE